MDAAPVHSHAARCLGRRWKKYWAWPYAGASSEGGDAEYWTARETSCAGEFRRLVIERIPDGSPGIDI